MPDKKIEDYLHLYLGCEVVYKNVRLNLSQTDRVNCDLYDNRINTKYHTSIKNIKPILRPLSDMSEEEAMEIFWKPIKGENFTIKTGEEFRLLLSKHFDLFGLIEAGLAIDKTTLK